jgi:hypothetical protein
MLLSTRYLVTIIKSYHDIESTWSILVHILEKAQHFPPFYWASILVKKEPMHLLEKRAREMFLCQSLLAAWDAPQEAAASACILIHLT